MADFVKVATVDEVAPGAGRCVEVGGRQIALFNVGGTIHAIDNVCPHRGGPLAEGDLDGTAVTCPWHAWQFDVTTGQSLTDDLVVERYEVKVEGGDVFVGV
jgi:NAD(P)H-dependent nitrite reductase small subunit